MRTKIALTAAALLGVVAFSGCHAMQPVHEMHPERCPKISWGCNPPGPVKQPR